ncbi:polycystin-2-like [Branchiostoma floridae]|uniref:Polycystin-2-like n=1 Tax=Branchiostoma floridae TaxID=7739 RepID=A0A9J7HR07_BRAFL|nr:polycystin-2-like [Branchiostoma floridae]
MKNDLIAFSITSAVAFMAFSSSGMVVFGTHMKAFSNVLHTNYALFDMLLGRFVAEEILEANRYVGPVYFTIFMVCVFIILVNFLVAIICDAIASDASIDQDYDLELVDYIWKSFQQIFGIHLPPTSDVKTGEDSLTELNANLQMIQESLDDTLDIAHSIWPDAEDTSDCSSFNQTDQSVASNPLSKKPSQDTYETANEATPQASTSAMSMVYEQAQSVLRTHEDNAARLDEVQNESRRRAQAIVQRKLAAKRRLRQTGRGDKRMEQIAENAEVLLEQHAADEARLERQFENNRRLFRGKLRQKLAARRKQKNDEKK